MKRLITIMLMFIMLSLNAQTKKKFELKIDSISIYHPFKDLKIKTFYKLENRYKQLDSVNTKFKTNEFILHFYRNDGRIMRCRYTLPQEKLIII